MNHYSFEFYGFAFFGIILARYLIFAGGTHLFLDKAFGKDTTAELLQARSGERLLTSDRGRLPHTTIGSDIKLSILSSLVFAVSAAAIASAYDLGITKLYTDVDRYPLWYLGASYLVAIVAQDAYFYFMHRLCHHKFLFRWCHQGHHRSNPPTPWTSFAFDLPEAIAHSLFLIGLVFIVPLHFITVMAVLTTMTVWAVVNHLGFDRLPASFPHHWCGRWFTGPAHHSIHHRHYGFHYGLYFTFWDRQLGTQLPTYEQEFANVTH
ncbi:sterol desaturase family protein [Chamaesiphon minutus]|uniref:Sterol desaturase n=1 Tax=Chamaesiphon minutus (strain ATCC 27169 / PCC 6605) TaxID=1173020 RepID=K9UHV8_CHAP6|nr:sterol desaturase family protein [Chamaesiphon minutus]AFY93769.1 sterol desaturase [Chamaesiphon minutus PCC 6605]